MSAYDIVATALECDRAMLGADSSLGQHPKWDSLAHLRLMLLLEQHYDVEITDETIRHYDNLTAIIRRHDELTSAAFARKQQPRTS